MLAFNLLKTTLAFCQLSNGKELLLLTVSKKKGEKMKIVTIMLIVMFTLVLFAENELPYQTYDEDFFKRFDDVEEYRGDTDIRYGKRFIMRVNSFVPITSSCIQSSDDKATKNNVIIKLLGNCTGNADPELTTSYLLFYKLKGNEKLRKPIYSSNKHEIYLFYPIEFYQAVLNQLRYDKTLYCWIGFFDNGHVYGDLHSAGELVTD